MKILNFTLLLVATLTILTSCKKEEIPVDIGCHFEQNDKNQDGVLDATEKAMLKECIKNKFTSKSEIENNLIGEWKLVGFGGLSNTQPCVYITITADELTFEYKNTYRDTTTIHSWEVEEINTTSFRLITFSDYIEELSISKFSSIYMFKSPSIVGGSTYIYQKVK